MLIETSEYLLYGIARSVAKMRGRKKNAAPMQDASQAPITQGFLSCRTFSPHAGALAILQHIYRGLAGASDRPVVILTKKVPE